MCQLAQKVTEMPSPSRMALVEVSVHDFAKQLRLVVFWRVTLDLDRPTLNFTNP